MTIEPINWQLLMPELVVLCTFLIVMIFDLFESIQNSWLAGVTILGSFIALIVSFQMLQAGTDQTQFNQMIRVDSYSLYFNIIFLISTFLLVLISINYL